MNAFKKIWQNRSQILEGFKNNLFKSEHVEQIAEERFEICKACPFIDLKGTDCLAPGTQPCCSKCGCSLKFKTRSLSSSCGDEENPRWKALLTEEEETEIKIGVDYQEPEE